MSLNWITEVEFGQRKTDMESLSISFLVRMFIKVLSPGI